MQLPEQKQVIAPGSGIIDHLETRPALVIGFVADGEGVAAEDRFAVFFIPGDEIFHFSLPYAVEILGALKKAGDERQSHGKTVRMAVLGSIASFGIGSFGILQHHLKFIGVEIPGHEPVLPENLVRNHGKVGRQAFLDILEIDAEE